MDPATISWSVGTGFSLDVCVKDGGEGLTTGSGASGTLSPQTNSGGQEPGVSHFAWTVQTGPVVTETESEPVVTETESEPVVTETESEGDVKDKFGEDESDESDESDEEVAVLDDGVEAPQVVQLPVGAAATGGGSTSGIEKLGLFAVGLALIAAAAPVLVVARRASRRS